MWPNLKCFKFVQLCTLYTVYTRTKIYSCLSNLKLLKRAVKHWKHKHNQTLENAVHVRQTINWNYGCRWCQLYTRRHRHGHTDTSNVHSTVIDSPDRTWNTHTHTHTQTQTPPPPPPPKHSTRKTRFFTTINTTRCKPILDNSPNIHITRYREMVRW